VTGVLGNPCTSFLGANDNPLTSFSGAACEWTWHLQSTASATVVYAGGVYTLTIWIDGSTQVGQVVGAALSCTGGKIVGGPIAVPLSAPCQGGNSAIVSFA
jgi:hypothetical protein